MAQRYLWSKRSEAFISILSVISVCGIALGVAVLIIVMAIMSGFEFELKEKLLGTNAHAVVRSITGEIPNWKPIRKRISEREGTESVLAFSYHQALLKSASRSTGVFMKGIDPEGDYSDAIGKYLIGQKRIEPLVQDQKVILPAPGGKTRESTLPGIVIGKELGKSLRLQKGDVVTVLVPELQSGPMGLVPRFKRFIVTGSYSSGLVEYESALVYINLETAQSLFGLNDSIIGLEIWLGDHEAAPAFVNDLRTELPAGSYAQDWTQMNPSLWEALQLEKTVYFIVLLLIVVMASFSVVSMLVMLVLEKRKDIAVLRTLGASSSEVARIFRTQGFLLGLVGTTAGVLLGLTVCAALDHYGYRLPEGVFPVTTLPIRIEWWNVAVTAAAALVISYLTTLYPSRKALSVEPAELIRVD